uniref:Beta-microseminoprotein n=1 Tax=Pelusios castaneus TaxID=367368 RepID=A0A8C8RNJ1_9SAUR
MGFRSGLKTVHQYFDSQVDFVLLGCVDKNGTLHKFNTEWRTKDCYRCSCTKEHMECCSLVATPTVYDKEKCKRIFHKEICRYTVVEKADPSKHCKVHGWVG